jgi:hypothetical protein
MHPSCFPPASIGIAAIAIEAPGNASLTAPIHLNTNELI